MIAKGNKHPYHDLELNFSISGSSSVLLAVHDQRTEMLSTQKPPEFVGYMRSGFGIPFAILTKSGQPLAADITNIIAKGLGKKAFQVKTITTSPSETHEQLVERMKAENAGMPVILHLTAWHSDAYQAVWYNYDLVLQVYGTDGKFLGQKHVQGRDSVGTTMWNPPKLARKKVPPALKQKLEEMFASPEIAGILK